LKKNQVQEEDEDEGLVAPNMPGQAQPLFPNVAVAPLNPNPAAVADADAM